MMLPFYSLSSSPARPVPRVGHSTSLSGRGLWLWLAALLTLTRPALAQLTAAAPLPPAVVLSTAGGHASAHALDSVLNAALDDLKVVNVVARPGLDLSAVQLALDCVAETPQCLRIVTSQHEAEMLVAPTLARISNELVLTLLRFDARTGKTQRVLKRQTGQTLSSDTLDAVPELLRELFGLPPKPKATPPMAAANQAPKLESSSAAAATLANEPLPEPPMEAPSEGRKVPVGPILLGSGGVLLIGAGLVMGVTVLNAESAYEDLTANTTKLSAQDAEAVVDQANEHKSTGQTNAVISNVFLGLGSAVIIGAGIWLALELSNRSASYEDQVRVTPWVGQHELGLVLTHRGAGL